MKAKVAKILFIISFLPWIIVPVNGILGAVFGVDFFFNTCYGWDGFLLGVLGALLGMTLVPILPVCLVYEICYIVRNKVPAVKKVPAKKFYITVGTVCAVIAVAVLLYVFRYEIRRVYETISAKRMSKEAEEQISFNENDISCDGILGIEEFTTDTVFVDYDKMRVGFLLGTVDEFWSVKLKETTAEAEELIRLYEEYFVQAKIRLSAPGKVLYSFSVDEDSRHRTVALLLETEDGTLYFADELKEYNIDRDRFTGLHWSRFSVEEGTRLSDLQEQN